MVDITIAIIPNNNSHCFVVIHIIKNITDSNTTFMVNGTPPIIIHIKLINKICDDISNIR